MKTYFVRTKNVASLQDALGRMIEYVKFLEDETGRSSESFCDQILEEDSIQCDIEEY